MTPAILASCNHFVQVVFTCPLLSISDDLSTKAGICICCVTEIMLWPPICLPVMPLIVAIHQSINQSVSHSNQSLSSVIQNRFLQCHMSQVNGCHFVAVPMCVASGNLRETV